MPLLARAALAPAMGATLCGVDSSDRPLPAPLPEGKTEKDYFDELLSESTASGNPKGWKPKVHMKDHFNRYGMRMGLWVRNHDEARNPNHLLRANVELQGVTPEKIAAYLQNLPLINGYEHHEDIEQLPNGKLVYVRVKAFMIIAAGSPRDHVWRFSVDAQEDGSTLVSIRSVEHERYPPRDGCVRAYYHSIRQLRPMADGSGTEITEFAFQDLRGRFNPAAVNDSLPQDTFTFYQRMIRDPRLGKDT